MLRFKALNRVGLGFRGLGYMGISQNSGYLMRASILRALVLRVYGGGLNVLGNYHIRLVTLGGSHVPYAYM